MSLIGTRLIAQEKAAPTVFELARDPDLRLDAGVAEPKAVLGFGPGERAIRYHEIVQYLRRLSETSKRVRFMTHGATHERRELVHVVISDPANMVRLDEIRAGLARLGDPRKTPEGEAAKIIEQSPAAAWMAYCVHGDEMSGTDASIWLAYRLAAANDEATLAILKNVVVCIDPLQNPDGRERFLSMLQQMSGKIPTGDTQSFEHAGRWPQGRTNHYLFDMNRDWYAAVQPESRGRIEAIASWHPQLVVDGHEMGSLDTFLFSPPREPLNRHIPPTALNWLRQYSTDQSKSFDPLGWSYYSGEWNEAWAIGFADIWAMHHGAAGILYEQARSAGSRVRLPSGQDRHYREDVAHQYVSSMSNLETLARNRKTILGEFAAAKREAVADTRNAGQRDVFVFVPGRNRTRAAEFLDTLLRQKIEAFTLPDGAAGLRDVVDIYGQAVTDPKFPPGAVAVSMRQPLGPLARAMLELDPRLSDEFLKIERRELELKGGGKLYDVTAWCLPMAFGVEAYWGKGGEDFLRMLSRPANREDMIKTPWMPVPATQPSATANAESPYGYVLDGDDDACLYAAAHLLDEGRRIRCASKAFTIEGRSFMPGSFLLRMNENADAGSAIGTRLSGLPAGTWTAVRTGRGTEGPDLGGGEFPLLTAPRVALLGESPIAAYSHGFSWHLLDAQVGQRISRFAADRLGRVDLRKYNVIVVPDAAGSIGDVFEDARPALERWICEGGTLVAMGNSAAALCRGKEPLSAVRLRPDVLKDLDKYAEAVWRERNAAAPGVDSAQVWDFDKAKGFSTSRPADQKIKVDDAEALQRSDAWAERFMPSGAILRGEPAPEHWLVHGVRGGIGVLYDARHVLMSMYPVETPVRLAPAQTLRMSGLLWPEARERLADAAYVTRESVGNGQIILFADDPAYRGFYQGTARLLLNAVILGPGLGASNPVPW